MNKNKKKIVNIYIDSIKFGGIEKNLVTILNNLNKEKYKINIIFLNKAIGEMFHQIKIPINTIFLNNNELTYKKLVLFSNYIKFLPKKFFRKFYGIPKADVEVIFPERLVPIFANKLTAKCKCSWNQTSIDPVKRCEYFNKNLKTKLIYYWGRLCYKKIDYVICVSELCKNQYERIYKENNAIVISGYINSKEISEISYAIDKNNIDQYNEKKIVFLGRLAWEKNIDLLLETVKCLSQKSPFKFKVFVIGEGPEKYKIENYQINNDNIILLGYMDNPFNVIRKCDCLISTSRYEGFGLTAVESMVCGTPVVSVDNGGISEILDNGKYGIITEQSADKLADGIIELLTNDLLYTNMIDIGHKRAMEFDIVNAIKKIENIFD